MLSYRNGNRNRNLDIFTAPTKAKSREPAYSRGLIICDLADVWRPPTSYGFHNFHHFFCKDYTPGYNYESRTNNNLLRFPFASASTGSLVSHNTSLSALQYLLALKPLLWLAYCIVLYLRLFSNMGDTISLCNTFMQKGRVETSYRNKSNC